MNTTLSTHTLKSYDRQLGHLLELILAMGGHLRALVAMAKDSLRTPSPERAAEAKAEDKEINRLEEVLEEAATETLALQHPVAVDLRFVITALKIAAMLERAGDLAKNVVKRAGKLDRQVSPATAEGMERMADAVTAMLNDALNAVKERDAAKAIAVWKRDDEVDALYRGVFDAAQAEMLANRDNIPSCTHILFMAKNFERMADYISNLAKTVHYVVTGRPADKSLLKDQ